MAALNSVIIARFSAIGDVAMTIPAVYVACRQNPGIQFVMLTRRGLDAMFVNAPENLAVEAVDLKDGRYKGVMGMRRLAKEMKGKWHPDAFVDLHDVIRTRLLGLFFRLGGIPVSRINKGRAEKKALTRQKNKCFKPLSTQLERYSATFRHAGIDVGSDFDGVFGGWGKAPAKMFAKISEPRPSCQTWIAVAPFAAHAGKVYPPEKMRQVVEELASKPGRRIFLLGGGGDEQAVLEQWSAMSENITSMAGKRYGFAAEMALLNHCAAAVVMDSANMHLAALAQTPTVAVWGATHPYAGFTAWNSHGGATLQSNLPCRPCSVFGNKPCIREDWPLKCMVLISPTDIIEATNKLVE